MEDKPKVEVPMLENVADDKNSIREENYDSTGSEQIVQMLHDTTTE